MMRYQMQYFPYDRQHLRMTFYVWGLPDYMMTLRPATPGMVIDNNNYVPNVQWHIDDYEVSNFTQGQDDMRVYGVQMEVWIKREPATIQTGVISPGILISFLSLLYVFLPRDDNRRIGYLTTILLTMVMFLVMMTNFVPIAHENP